MGSAVALTVRQTLNSPYADRRVVYRSDGTWVYGYHQEGRDAEARHDYTNIALLANIDIGAPLAALIQTQTRPKVMYRVLGLALVTRWSDGFFYLEGIGTDGSVHLDASGSEDAVLEAEAERVVGESLFDLGLDPLHDARVRTKADIVRRQGQASFRKKLLEAYQGRCAITECSVSSVLDAAHIQPYMGPHTNHPSNGLLVRTDLHALLDGGLLAIHPVDRRVVLAPSLYGSEYEVLEGRQIREPTEVSLRPSESALAAHLEWCGDRIRKGEERD